MGRKKLPLTPVRAERLRTLREREELSQAVFASRVGYQDQRQISAMECGKRRVSDDACKAVIRAFPAYRLSWLMGDDEVMTRSDAVSWVKHVASVQDDALDRAITELFIAADIQIELEERDGSTAAYLSKAGQRIRMTDEMIEQVKSEVYGYFDYLMYKIVQ